jgi:hypothetical protein
MVTAEDAVKTPYITKKKDALAADLELLQKPEDMMVGLKKSEPEEVKEPEE